MQFEALTLLLELDFDNSSVAIIIFIIVIDLFLIIFLRMVSNYKQRTNPFYHIRSLGLWRK